MFTLDFYAYWNADQVAALLRAVAGITSSKGYAVFLSAAALLGFLCVTAASAVRYRGINIVYWFAAVVLFYLILFAPKVNVTVQDSRMMSAQTVQGVPLGVGFTASLSSQLGHWAADLFETALADADAERFTSFGAVFPERAAAAIAAAGPIRPETRKLLDPWVERCVVPEILESDAKMTELMRSNDLVSTVLAGGWTNPARFVMVEGSPVSCTDAGNELLQVLRTVEIPAQEKLLVARLTGHGASGMGADPQASAVVEAAIRKAVPEAAASMLGVSKSLSESLSHALLLSEIPAGVHRTAGAMEMPVAGAVALAKAQGNLASEISFRTMSELAAAFLPKLRNLLEFILIAAFPLVMGMLVACGAAGGSVARMYMTLFLWLALWAPIAAVINWLLIHIDANPMNRLADLYGGLTLEAADLIRDQGATSQAMAGYLMLLVPVISYLIAKASDMGAASLASSVMSPASSAAQSQSAQISMGNIASGNASVGNVSANNASANKSDVSTGFVAGSVTRTSSAAGTVVRDGSTGQVTSVTAATSDLGVSATSTLTEGRSSSSGASSGSTFSIHSGISTGSTDYFRNESGVSGMKSSTGTTSASTLASSGETLASGHATSTTADARSSTSMSAQSGMSETLGLESRLGGSFTMKGSETAEQEASGTMVGDLMQGTQLAQALLSGVPRGSAGAAGAAGAFAAAGAGAAGPAGGKNAGQMSERGRVSADAGFDAGGRFKVGTQASRTDNATESFSSGTTQSAQDSNVFESRLEQGQESRRQAAQTGSVSEARTASDGHSGEVAASKSALRATSTGLTQHSESRSGLSHAAGARMDTYLMHAAIEQFGSPEEALEALQNPVERAAFARNAMYASKANAEPMAYEAPEAPAAEMVGEKGQAGLDQHWEAARADARAEMADQKRTAAEGRALARGFGSQAAAQRRGGVQAEGFAQTAKSFEAERSARGFEAGNTGASKAQEALLAARGAARAAAALWEENQSTAQGVMGTVLLGGLLYESPQAVYDGLVEASGKSPELREALLTVGRGSVGGSGTSGADGAGSDAAKASREADAALERIKQVF